MKYLLVTLLVITMLLAFGCESDPGVVDEEVPEEDENDVVDEVEGPIMALVDTPPQLDGSGEGFTSEPFTSVGADIYLAHDGSNLYVHMEAETGGWLSVGFNEQGGGMDGSNMILGYLDDGNSAYRNDVGQGRNHSEIGSPSVEDFYFSADNGLAVMAFSYPLEFPQGEGFNLDGLNPGETYTMIVGVHGSSYDISNVHSARGSVVFSVQP